MTPFRHFVAVSGGSLPAVADKRLDQLRDYARNASSKPLELGTFAAQLAHLDTPDTSALPPTAVVYMQFLSTLSEPEYLQRRLSSELLNATRNFRNRAAHPDPVTFRQLHAYLVYLLGEGDEKGLLARLISASRPLANAMNRRMPL